MAKRFYETVDIKPHQHGYVVTLDKRVLKTPGKQELIARDAAHARLIADEWAAQEGEIKPHLMPVTRLYNVAVERTPDSRAVLTEEVRKYAGTDVLCYRADTPHALQMQQKLAWDKWLVWAADLGIKLLATDGLMAITQDAAALDNAAKMAGEMDDLNLTLLAHFTAVYGSAILALAVVTGALGAAEGYDISRVDALYQIEHWGADEQAEELALATRVEVVALSKLL